MPRILSISQSLYRLVLQSAFNFQANNFGKGGQGNDPILMSVQDPSGTNNANFATPPEQASRSCTCLWSVLPTIFVAFQRSTGNLPDVSVLFVNWSFIFTMTLTIILEVHIHLDHCEILHFAMTYKYSLLPARTRWFVRE